MNTPVTDLSVSGTHSDYLRTALKWHFSEETGSQLWLDLAKVLDFDPLTDIRTFADLARFPDIGEHLRRRPVADLIPRGLAEVPQIYETGGTTGAPKRLAYSDDWIANCLAWKTTELREAGFPEGRPWLVAMPSGPHAYGNTARLQARELGSILHTIDVDPRWVKKEIAAHRDTHGYVTHLLDQIRHVVDTQQIAALTTTPPILAEIAADDALVTALNRHIRYIALAGAHLDPDTYDLLTEIFPGATIQNVYGSTMILTTARIRNPHASAPEAIYDGYPPHVSFHVVDEVTGESVDYYTRGQVRMTHISRAAFIPNNLERDSAIRIPGHDNGIGDGLRELRPLPSFDGETVIEGVY